MKPTTGKLFHSVRHGRRVQFKFAALVIFGLSLPSMQAFADCKLSKLVELPVTMNGLRPLITAKIDGQEVQFMVDSGAFYSMLTPASAAQLNLKLSPAPFGLRVTGINGSIDTSIATVKVLTLAGIPIRNVEFLVGGGEVGRGSVGVLGQNFFRIGDVEYDLAKGAMRLMRAEGCNRARLAYWVKPTDPYSRIDIDFAAPNEPHTMGTAYINGAKIRVMFDSGAATSILTRRAAERAGVKPDSSGVSGAGYSTGIGRASVKSYIGTFASFKIGDEEIKNARLRFGDLTLETADMLLGADFFLSHRIYVASSQRKLYFTYNGGPVFNLSGSASSQAAPPAPQPTQAGTGAAADAALDATGDANKDAARDAAHDAAKDAAHDAAHDAANDAVVDGKKELDAPVDAAGFSRRGTAFASRHVLDRAIADLSRACELAPENPEYRYQRGIAYWQNKQIDLASMDFDRALELKPDYVPPLTARAQLRLTGHDYAGAILDLDVVDRVSAKEADVRLFLAQAYEHADLWPRSIAQYELWASFHQNDARLDRALNGSCWGRALLGEELPKALNDCNTALKRSPRASPMSARILNSRGLVRLRLGDYDKSIADYDDSLKLVPRDAWSLYGRGVAKIRKKKTAEGEADIAAAAAIWPGVAHEFERRGILP